MRATIPSEGERVEVSELHGYRLVQERPFECRHRCTCGLACDGVTVVYPGTVEKVTFWADNSVEATVACDDGQRRILRLVAPHGDVCF